MATSANPRRDRRITTVRGALRQLSMHCGIYGDELTAALDRNDTQWLATEFRLRALQILMDIETLAGLAAQDPDPPDAVGDVMWAAGKFMAGLCDVAGLPDVKRQILATLAERPTTP